ncbi:MAG: hypothetical protein COV45_08435 [Deltaproteobacteria bacterium CG11_big_fil_rev_8_21_14_0_20_47_16]|nr:MAG: hypothetical protein COV45_08435 [Deltaproteobacteria bacterium CG11_big_fil_rev_8_21_14_0_20_47_16]
MAMKKPNNSETLLKQLLGIKAETQNLDFKLNLNWKNASKRARLEIVKDVLSIANVQDGGHIVVGVDDSTYEPVGVDSETFASFDVTSFNQFLQSYADPVFSCHIHKIGEDKERKFVIIDIPEFQEIPIIAKQDGHDSDGNQIIKSGQVYYRTEKATCGIISSAQDMRELLGRALMKRKQDLLHSIESIMQGRPPARETNGAPYKSEIDSAQQTIQEKLGKDFGNDGYWEVIAYPKSYSESRLKDQPELGNVIKKSNVSLRGWSFPYLENLATTYNTQNGVQSYYATAEIKEGYRAFKSGLFVWCSDFWKEDVSKNPDSKHPIKEKNMCFISAIYQLTEIMLFLSRYFNAFDAGDEVDIQVSLKGLRGRKLISSDWHVPGLYRRSYYVAEESQFDFKEEILLASLTASYAEIASDVAIELFKIFNMNDMRKETVRVWQEKLLKKQF